MFYLGYLPSFWVRLRALGEIRPTRFPTILKAITIAAAAIVAIV